MLAPSFALVLVFVYGFILYTAYLSLTDSQMLPSYGWVGFENYVKLCPAAVLVDVALEKSGDFRQPLYRDLRPRSG